MPLDPAYDKAVKDLRELSPYVAANKAGVSFDGRQFRAPFFNRLFAICYPEGEVSEAEPTAAGAPGLQAVGATQASLPLWLQIVVLHYIATASGASIADDWVTFRELPGGYIYEKAFVQQAIRPLEDAFGTDLAGFRRAAEALGGIKMSRTGDAAYWFMAFPRLRMGCILFTADEEVPASVNILFDRAAGNYLPTEDLAAIGEYLSTALRRTKG